MTLDDILKLALKKGASDVHLKAGIMPVIRKHGVLRPLSSKLGPLSGDDIHSMAMSVMDEKQKNHFEEVKDIDVAYGISGLGRFRINILRQRSTTRMVIRNIPDKVKPLTELNLPPLLAEISTLERGLILVTGATGSGKTSTMAGIIDHINRTRSRHILMIEDPTEFLLQDRKSIITQRELGVDATSFSGALRAALRQDPDVILIGEMRDRETIEIALLAAETGHLVLSTLHTLDAQETINRILASFEGSHQMQVRLQLAAVLKAVISQRLTRKKDNDGFAPAVEIMLNNARISELIANPKRTHEIQKAIEEGEVAWGMQSFDQSLMRLIEKDLISYEEALKHSSHPENFAIKYQGVSQMDGKKWGESTQFRKRVAEGWQNLTDMDLEETTKFKAEQPNKDDKAKPKRKTTDLKKVKKS